jgi:toxin ParE1/3/4
MIAQDNPKAASELVARIEAKVMPLADPTLMHMGRPGLVEGTRELLEWPHIIVYKVDEAHGEIVVISVVHGARKRERDQGD